MTTTPRKFYEAGCDHPGGDKERTPMAEILPGYFYVPIPDGANSLHVIENKLLYRYESEKMPLQLIGEAELPPGSYAILFTRDEATEEKWKGVVEGYVYSGRVSFQAYKDYSGKKPQSMEDIISNPSESGASLLRSHNLPVEDNFVIIKSLNKK